ncbi:YdcF family protein [Lysobacter sp. TY2-98]|uniref:YdcF family protein n=1 Tax=Lysobacter sp. TY2-98 TaxID=2290922 RepID=UPI000E208EA1|nr:YdcF family protein [Lysobacter sp. TY2-98]AXK73048.1 YdcF family protein [Lysobacter sp. TY2-98]
MSSRAHHQFTLFRDRDVLLTGIVTLAACVLSAGLVYLAYLVHVVRTALRAPCAPEQGAHLLLFGKHAPRGRIDTDFAARLDRAAQLWRERPSQHLVLLGGGAQGELSEAEIARRELFARGLAPDTPLQLESGSRDTLQNLRNARQMLGDAVVERVTLLSNRYHLARCALFARQLGFDVELCAAEPRLRLTPRMLLRLAGEAAYICWADIGTRWARFVRSERMLARVT